eukprot:SAG31_NODE_323_length_17713_cov_12.065834_6_plen_304_part_00
MGRYNAGPSIRNHGAPNSHLALHIGAVQHREALLATSALDANDALQFSTTPTGNLFKSLTTNLILPSDADEWMVKDARGKTVAPLVISPTTGQLELGTLWLDVPSTVCLRKGGGALCIKVFELDGVAGYSRSLSLVADSLGQELNAVRLVGSHYRSPDGLSHWLNRSAANARFGALLLAGRATNSSDLATLSHRASDSRISSTITAGIWIAEVNTTAVYPSEATMITTPSEATLINTVHDGLLAPVKLSIERDLECTLKSGLRFNQSVHTSWNCLRSRKISGHEVLAGPFRVNGKNLTELMLL